ncbi:MAG: hypothetical protein AABZ47_12580 [Planctomycetota bacterium]
MARGYRKARVRTSAPQGVDTTPVLGDRGSVELPVSVAEVLDGVSAEIERLTGEAGLLIMKAVMHAEVESLAGPKGRHDPHRIGAWWTTPPGYVVLAGKKVKVTKRRVRDKACHEVFLSSYHRFQSPLRRQASICRKLIRGLSTRK